MAAGDDPRFVRVTCPTCRAVLHPRVEKAGRRVRCPDCYSAVLVPQPPEPEAPPKKRDPGEYGVRDALAAPRSEADSADFFLVLCPKCQARLHPRRSHASKRARCPDCDTIFVVPPPPKPERKQPPPTPGKYAMGEEATRVEAEFHYLTVDRADEPEPEPPAPPDTGWFVRGVFTFPWWPGPPLAYWAVLSSLFLPALALVGVVVLVAEGNVKRGVTVARILAVPIILLWVWVLAYAAACFAAIVQDTGSGNDEVAGWPEGDWRDRMGTLLYVLWHFGLSLGAGAALAGPVGMLVGPQWGALTTVLAANFFFPLFLLSSMEAATLLAPYSPVMLRSLLKTPGGWLVVYVESLVLLVLTFGLIGAGLFWLPMVTAVLASPLLATFVFIDARLYGRLAWHIGQLESKRKPRKRKRKTTQTQKISSPPTSGDQHFGVGVSSTKPARPLSGWKA